jgi:hypothetical protein
LIIEPVLKCVAASRIDEEIVDYEEPFRVWFTTVEGQSDRPTTVSELGGSETVNFAIPQVLEGNWLENTAVFLPPEDERVSGIEFRFSSGSRLRHTGFGASRSSKIPVYHIIGKAARDITLANNQRQTIKSAFIARLASIGLICLRADII